MLALAGAPIATVATRRVAHRDFLVNFFYVEEPKLATVDSAIKKHEIEMGAREGIPPKLAAVACAVLPRVFRGQHAVVVDAEAARILAAGGASGEDCGHRAHRLRRCTGSIRRALP